MIMVYLKYMFIIFIHVNNIYTGKSDSWWDINFCITVSKYKLKHKCLIYIYTHLYIMNMNISIQDHLIPKNEKNAQSNGKFYYLFSTYLCEHKFVHFDI